ncbi:MAG: hypothetical protein FWC41_02240 [Firmicutes bacterium]|nr:hypothetical protein [Bacillota bacterium]
MEQQLIIQSSVLPELLDYLEDEAKKKELNDKIQIDPIFEEDNATLEISLIGIVLTGIISGIITPLTTTMIDFLMKKYKENKKAEITIKKGSSKIVIKDTDSPDLIELELKNIVREQDTT